MINMFYFGLYLIVGVIITVGLMIKHYLKVGGLDLSIDACFCRLMRIILWPIVVFEIWKSKNN